MLDLFTIQIFLLSVLLFSAIILLYVHNHFKSENYTYTSFIIYFFLYSIALTFNVLQMHYDISIFIMISGLFVITARFYYLNGFLQFFQQRISRLFYGSLLAVLVFSIHILWLLNVDRSVFIIILMVHDIIIHGAVLYVVLV